MFAIILLYPRVGNSLEDSGLLQLLAANAKQDGIELEMLATPNQTKKYFIFTFTNVDLNLTIKKIYTNQSQWKSEATNVPQSEDESPQEADFRPLGPQAFFLVQKTLQGRV